MKCLKKYILNIGYSVLNKILPRLKLFVRLRERKRNTLNSYKFCFIKFFKEYFKAYFCGFMHFNIKV